MAVGWPSVLFYVCGTLEMGASHKEALWHLICEDITSIKPKPISAHILCPFRLDEPHQVKLIHWKVAIFMVSEYQPVLGAVTLAL